ncbi:MAG: hypothetical protein ABS942_08040 [Solibacillus sp.]|uniref:hypothetical protein n=1 Tax=unclassified Solibacillus TaxID=2637870 RepID=UPI003100AE0F
MIGKILLVLFLFFCIMKFYKNRNLFKQLTKKEWLQYIAGFLCAWAVAAIIIIGGSNLTDNIESVWINKIVAILFIFIGLAFAGVIMKKTLPEKLMGFYS